VSGLEARRIDVHDDAQMRRFHEIGWRAEMEDGRPWNTFQSFEEMAVALREPSPGQRSDALGIFDGDRMVGGGIVWLSLDDNVDKAFVFPAVEPDLRGRGIGGARLEALVEHVGGLGRTEVMSGTSYRFEERDDSPAQRFAAAHGFVPANQLAVDAPTGDLEFEEEAFTPEAFRHEAARDRKVGRTVLRSLAVHDGVTVAHSDLLVRPHGTRAVQWATLVHRDHRGHRLGAAVKVANLRRLQRERPDLTEVVTQNAEVNAQMIGINARLGFEPVALVPEFLRRL
jgi:GNAT superfamily N-acetyltransferase